MIQYLATVIVSPFEGRPYQAISCTTAATPTEAGNTIRRSLLSDRSIEAVSIIEVFPADQ